MKAKALLCDRKQNFTLAQVVLPGSSADQIAIRTHYSGVSIGTEFALIRGKLSWGPYPLCTGYQGTGVVEAAGDSVKGIEVGDRVYFRGNDQMAFPDGRGITCVSGTHCSHVVVTPDTTHGAEKLPDGLAMDTASMFVMPAVGLHGVDMANPRMGSTVVVYGAGQIGLGVVAACSHRGCVVIAVDLNSKQLDIARRMGADHVIDGSKQDVAAEVKQLTGQGAETVFECTGLPECVDPAIELCRPFGSFVWQGNYGEAPVSLKFLPPHGRRLQMFFPCDDGFQPCRRAVLKNMAMGALKWENAITHRIDHTEAPAMFERINRGDRDIVGVVINWQE